MLSEGFSDEYKWIAHDSESGRMPVPTGTLVDVKYRDGCQTAYGVPCDETADTNRDASYSFWISDGADNDIVAWRLHVPSKLSQPTRPAPPMPTIKPPKGSYENVECSSSQTSPPVFVPEAAQQEQSRVVQAFNRMTGHNITDDNLNTLKVLLELFSNETFGK